LPFWLLILLDDCELAAYSEVVFRPAFALTQRRWLDIIIKGVLWADVCRKAVALQASWMSPGSDRWDRQQV
jgi:hypothetical protein